MTEKFRQLMSQLHLATKTYQLEKVAMGVHRLLQLAHISEKELGESILPEDYAGAKAFWCRLLGATTVSTEFVQNSALSVYAVVQAAAHNAPSRALQNLATKYCDTVAEVCEHYLAANTAVVKTFSAPVPKPAPHLHVVEN